MKIKKLIIIAILVFVSLSFKNKIVASTDFREYIDLNPKIATNEDGTLAIDVTESNYSWMDPVVVTTAIDVSNIATKNESGEYVWFTSDGGEIYIQTEIEGYNHFVIDIRPQFADGSTDSGAEILSDKIKFVEEVSSDGTQKVMAYVPVMTHRSNENLASLNGIVLAYDVYEEGSNMLSDSHIVSNPINLIDAINQNGDNTTENTDNSDGNSISIPSVLDKIYYIRIPAGSPPATYTVHYDSLPFYFCIDENYHNGKAGTYLLDLDQKNQTVTFLWHSTNVGVGYVKENESTKEYKQVGANVINLLSVGIVDETVPSYIIEEVIVNDLTSPATKLKNGFVYTNNSNSSYIQKENSYVFANLYSPIEMNRNGTIVYKFVGLEQQAEKAGFLEMIITRIMEAIGDAFLWVIRLFLGSDVTIDKIIFNEYDPVVIDFEGGRGWFAQILPRVEPIYIGFRNIASGIYLVALLYIGLTILLSAGDGFKQKLYTQHLTNWVVGLVLLFVAPSFFKYIPSAVNAIVGEMKGQVTRQYTYYNLDDAKLLAWGFTQEEIDELRGTSGEDTRTVWVEALIGKRDELNEELEKKKLEYNEKIGPIRQIVYSRVSSAIFGIGDEDTELIQALVDSIISKIQAYCTANNTATIPDDAWNTIFAGVPQRRKNTYSVLRTQLRDVPTMIYEINTGTYNLESINEVINALQYDLMGQMRSLSGSTNRLVYAVVWLICIYEMIVILCLYYRRVIVMTILILIYPLVAATYPFDKLGDGKSQSISTWFKEFTVNLIVQVAHAVVYVVLVEAGKRLYIANSNNWLFFLLAVLFIFPAERIIRSIFGLQGNTIGNLKANVGSTIAGTVMAVNVGKNMARSINQKFGRSDGAKKLREEKENKEKKARESRDKRDAYLKGRADQKERIRRRNRLARTRRATNMLQKSGYAMMNLASSLRSQAYRIGNAGRKLKGKYRKIQDSRAMKFAGSTWRMARGGAGITFGAAEFVKSAGMREGLGTAYATSVAKGRLVGGFKTYGQTPLVAKPQSTSSSGTATSGSSSTGAPSAGGSATYTTTGSGSTTTRTTTHTRTTFTGERPPSDGGSKT